MKFKAKVINNNFRIITAIKSGWLIGKTIIFINNLNNNNMKINKVKEPGIYDRKAFDIAYRIREGLPVTEEERQYFRNN